MATPTTTTKPETKPDAEPSPTIKRGMIALLWNPANEPGIAGSVAGATPIRMWSYGIVKGYAQQAVSGREKPSEIPVFETVELKYVGRNWVDNELWQKAKQQSKERYEAALANGDASAYDAIARLLKAKAIVEFTPQTESVTLTGSLSDYNEEDARELVLSVHDADVLRAEMKAESRVNLVNFISARIRDLESGDLGNARR